MTRIDIISGFLGAGKTTLIKKLLPDAFPGEKLVLIENEFGEISVDGGFLKDSGVEISEMSSGCICCSLVGDFRESLMQVWRDYSPDRILIEPSGVGKLSDVIAAVKETAAQCPDMVPGSAVTVADAVKVKVYTRNFGEFYNNQIEHADAIILSRTQSLSPERLHHAVTLLREKNPTAAILTTPWDQLESADILRAIEKVSLAEELLHKMHADPCAACHEHDHCHDHDHCHEHEHHEHDEHCTCGCHDHDHEHHHEHHHEHEHHEHDEHCTCGCHDHDHDHHHHHHADEVFTSWGRETPRTYSADELQSILAALDSGAHGTVLRAKGILPCTEGGWLEFDYVPGEMQVRDGKADYTGRLCVIGSDLKEEGLAALFGL